MSEQFLELRAPSREADIVSYDEKTRTADMQFSVGSRVLRWSWDIGQYYEQVSMDPAHADLTRVAKGAVPFLKDHRGSVDNVLGNVQEASVDGSAGIAKVRFSKRASVQEIVDDIKDGILKSVSMGYWPRIMEKIGEENGIPVFLVSKWELGEISSVATPADPDAAFRSAMDREKIDKSKLIRCEIRGHKLNLKTNPEDSIQNKVETERSIPQDQNTGEITMTEAEKKLAEEQAKRDADEKLRAAEKAAKEAGAKAERERQADIRKAVRAAGFEDSFAEDLISREISIHDARGAIIDKLAEKDKASSTRSTVIEAGDQDEVSTRREALKEAILFRAMPETYKLTDRGREFSGMRLLEMARESLRRQGIKVGHLGPNELAGRALHSTSDFPNVLADIINKTLRDAFVGAPQTFDPIVKRVQNPDFKQISRVNVGLGSALTEILESGEITYGTMGESAEKYFIKEYAKGLSITRRVLINDDLEAFTRIPAKMGAKAKSLESDLVWAVITANAAMADTIALFHASHGNLGSAAAISIASLGIARSSVRAQKEMDGEPLNLPVKWLIVPTELETVAEQYISQVQANVQTSNNPFAPGGRTPLGLIVEPRLSANSATAWYVATDKSLCDILELATLSGSTEPEVAMEEGFDTLGMKFRVVHSVGTKAIEYRGLFKNAGA